VNKIQKMLLLAPGAVHGKLPGGTGSTILAFKKQKKESQGAGFVFLCLTRSHT